jgi:hypothetical protein
MNKFDFSKVESFTPQLKRLGFEVEVRVFPPEEPHHNDGVATRIEFTKETMVGEVTYLSLGLVDFIFMNSSNGDFIVNKSFFSYEVEAANEYIDSYFRSVLSHT